MQRYITIFRICLLCINLRPLLCLPNLVSVYYLYVYKIRSNLLRPPTAACSKETLTKKCIGRVYMKTRLFQHPAQIYSHCSLNN